MLVPSLTASITRRAGRILQPRSFHVQGHFPNLLHSRRLGVEQKVVNKDVFGLHCFSATVSVRKVRVERKFHVVEKMVKSQRLQAEGKCEYIKLESGMKSDHQLEWTNGRRQLRKSRGNKVKPEPVNFSVKRDPEGEFLHVETRPQTRSIRNRVKTEPVEYSVKQEAPGVVKDSETRPQRRKASARTERKSEAEELVYLVKEEQTDREELRRRKVDQVVERGCSEMNSKKSKKSEDLDSPKAEEATALVLVDATNVTPASGADLPLETSLVSLNLSLPYRGPYPSHTGPYPEECEAVRDLLTNLHGDLPEYQKHRISCPTIETSCLQIQGADRSDSSPAVGVAEAPLPNATALVAVEQTPEVVAVLTGHPRERRTVIDSLVGTLLSQNTTDNNSRKAFASLKRKFPTWQEVLEADPKDVEESIRCGGLAEIKAGRILNILKTLSEERGELCMEYLRRMSNEEIKTELSRFKGVGPKTVACVLMFHLQRNEFPVDTHVFRISKALGWVPASADREKAYLHLNERIPDHLKFDLHCLFVTHGKNCPHCVKRQTKKPKDVECPLANWRSRVSKGRTRSSALLMSGSEF
ncbi:hypothetical protein Mapa_007621 [Marchantia paleacea]|nr:hypothetical protein Mapa_007621 [Marchantia paleacea]